MKQIFPPQVYNPITLVGAAIAMVCAGLIAFLVAIELLSSEPNPYVGILAYVLFPGGLMFGLVVIAVGYFREMRRERHGIVREKLPVLDFNDRKQMMLVMVFTVGTAFLILFLAFDTYKAYEFTESDEFCGKVCHKVMEPEYTAYLHSPHSRVGCVKCHIGSGTSWYLKSKISGAYQLYSVLFNKYSRPIPTPVHSLRPAAGTCEQCHSPSHFFSAKRVDYDFYLSDEKNSRSRLTMLLKIGGGNSEFGNTGGIHWHMNLSREVEYIHTDERRLVIPWVKVRTRDGKEKIYRSDPAFQDSLAPAEHRRTMDCIDCHNRPSHIYNQPDKMVNLYLGNGKLDHSLPFIKNISVQALETRYSDREAGIDSIARIMENFYQTNYPEVWRTQRPAIDTGVAIVRKIWKQNYFPYMGANWKEFPDNIAHHYTPGCFRCHDGKHVSEDGSVISKDCNACHLIISQNDSAGRIETSLEGLKFRHPVELGGPVEDQTCTDCHYKRK